MTLFTIMDETKQTQRLYSKFYMYHAVSDLIYNCVVLTQRPDCEQVIAWLLER